MMTGIETLAIQVSADGLHFGDKKLPWDVGDMLLYADPITAPAVHPAENRLADASPAEPTEPMKPGHGTLFGDLST